MRTRTVFCALYAFAVSLVPAQVHAPTKEELLALPCFKPSTRAEFEAAEKQVATTVQLWNHSKDGPVWVSPGTRKDFVDSSATVPIHGISLRGAATYADTRPGLLLRCVIRAGEKQITQIEKYYVTVGPLDQIDPEKKKNRGARDAAFVWFYIPDEELSNNIQTVDVTAISLGSNGRRTKYVYRVDWNSGSVNR